MEQYFAGDRENPGATARTAAQAGTGQARAGQAATEWPLARMVRDYWQLLKVAGKGGMPRRAAVDPRAIAPALHSVFLASRVTMGLVRIRIGGTTLVSLAGIEVMDMPLSLLFTPEARPQLALAVERVLHDGAIATLDLAAECSPGRTELSARLLLLPLVAMDESSTIMLGCLECGRPVPRQSRRFAITGCRTEAGPGPAGPKAAGAPAARETVPTPATGALARPPASAGTGTPAPAPPPIAPAMAAGHRRRPAHLRLVHSV